MLETLDDIDWTSLSHAYGSAEDIPKQLRILANEPSQQENVLYGLYASIYHQGSIYDATAAAIPFLLEIALDPSHAQRDEIFYFIAHCCRTNMWFSERNSPESMWSREIVDAVGTSADALIAQIGQEPENERGALTCLYYCEDRNWVALNLLERFEAIDPSNLLLAALASHGSEPESLDAFFELATDRTMRLAALTSKATIGGLTSRQVKLLQEGIGDPEIREPLEQLLAEVADSVGSFPELLAMTTRDVWPLIIPSLCAYMEQSPTRIGWRALVTLLGMAFESPLDPVEPSSLTDNQRMILETAVRSKSIWNVGNTSFDISDKTGISITGYRGLANFLSYDEPVVALIMTPAESPIVQHRLEKIDRLEWKTTPWMIFRGDTSALDEQIHEEADYFTKQVMSDAKQIANTIISNIADDVVANLSRFRFYPNLSKAQLIGVCESNGWVVHEAPGWAHELSSISEAEVMADPIQDDQDPGLSWDQLTDRQRAEIDQCVTLLDDAGWQEAKNWTAFAKSAGFSVTPLMVARYFGMFDLEVGYWPYDRAIARQTGTHTGKPYLSLTVVDDGQPVSLRLYYNNDLPNAVWLITKFQDELAASEEGFTSFIRAAIEGLEEVMLEFDGGILQKMTLEAAD